MCLYTKQHKFRVAEEDIVCWKVLEIVDGNYGEKIITPFAFRPVTEDELSGKVLFTPNTLEAEHLQRMLDSYPDENESFTGIEDGVIHTYGAKDIRAIEMYDEMTYHVGNIGGGEGYIGMHEGVIIGCGPDPEIVGIALYKCVIPRGAEYIEGTYTGHGYSGRPCPDLVSYGSKAIRFVEKVAEWRRDDGYDTGNTCLWDKVCALRKEVTHEE